MNGKVIATVLFLAGCMTATCLALPASPKQDDVEMLPPEIRNPYGDEPIVDTGVIGFGGGVSNPFGGLFENIESIMTRMRQQMETLLRHFNGSANSTSSDFPGISSGGFAAISPFGDVDLSKGNTTSVTKVIDGHKVVINETEYKKEDDFGGAFFKVRIIDVKPNSSEESTEKDAEGVATSENPTIKDVEPVDDSSENEIPKGKEALNYENLELFDEVDAFRPSQHGFHPDNSIETFDDNSIEYRPPDLSGDIYVNTILQNSGAATNPDAEVFDVTTFNRPRDLSRDTYVNRIAEESGATVNPDAEIFDVETFDGARFNMPWYKFVRR